jgi:hypothetical protein
MAASASSSCALSGSRAGWILALLWLTPLVILALVAWTAASAAHKNPALSAAARGSAAAAHEGFCGGAVCGMPPPV